MPNIFSAATLNIITTVGIIAAGLGYIIDKFFSGRKQHHVEVDGAQEKLIDTLTKQLEAQEKINDSLNAQIHDLKSQFEGLTAEVAHLKGINEANEKKVQEYLQIIAYRNPDVDKTLANISTVVTEVVPFMQEMKESHRQLREGLESLTAKRKPKEKHDAA